MTGSRWSLSGQRLTVHNLHNASQEIDVVAVKSSNYKSKLSPKHLISSLVKVLLQLSLKILDA